MTTIIFLLWNWAHKQLFPARGLEDVDLTEPGLIACEIEPVVYPRDIWIFELARNLTQNKNESIRENLLSINR
jgi:hypothetical protein